MILNLPSIIDPPFLNKKLLYPSNNKVSGLNQKTDLIHYKDSLNGGIMKNGGGGIMKGIGGTDEGVKGLVGALALAPPADKS